MAAVISPSKKPVKQLLSNEERWDLLKAQGIEILKLEFHQSTSVFTTTTKTCAAFKPALKGLKMWRTPTCFLLELKGKKQGVELTTVATWEPV